MTVEDCSNCRHHSKYNLPKKMDSRTLSILNKDAPPEIVYICKHNDGHKTVGTTPIFCDHYETPKHRSLAEMDAMIEQFNKRDKRKEDKE